ncbi:MAG TPA: nitrous oxide reductase accessory protein NosL [Ignavibacteria bacterium]|nr:nitrous oxide reductase accessory protein NosL [Ignavibacteria bacterium]
MNKAVIILVMSIFLFASCGNAGSPDPINFGSDLCAHCNMKIMDTRFGAEILTSKGKAYKFDAVECMLDYMKSDNSGNAAYWVIDYNNPETLINAESAYYLVSMKIKSPMGEFLSCYKNSGAANESKSSNGGEVFDWKGLKAKFNVGR